MGQIFDRLKNIWKSQAVDFDVNNANRIVNDKDDELKRIIDELNNPKTNQQKKQQNNYEQSNHSSNHSNVRTNNEFINACRILNVSPNADVTQIKSAYKKLIKEHHPDKFANKNNQSAAQTKTQEINNAYNYLKKYLNFN